MDRLPQDFPPPGSSVSLFTSGLLSLCRVQPVVDESREVCCLSLPSVFIPAIDSPVASVLTIADVGLSVVSSSAWSSPRSLSPDSVQSDGSFYSAADSPTGRHLPCFLNLHSFRLCVRKDLLLRRHPTLGLGMKRVVVPTGGSQPTGIMILLSRTDTLVYSFTTCGSWSGWGLRNMLAYWAVWIHSMSRLQTVDAARQLQHDACLMTSNLNVLDQYILCLQGMASELLELVVGHHDFLSMVVDSTAPVPRVLH